MCSYCKQTLKGLCVPHKPTECPLRQGDYCSICASYGHVTEECPQQSILSMRVPQTFEQILHPNLLETYGLTETSTPLPSCSTSPTPPKDPRMMIPERKDAKETDKCIQAILRAHGITPGNQKTNKEKIAKLAVSLGLRLVYV